MSAPKTDKQQIFHLFDQGFDVTPKFLWGYDINISTAKLAEYRQGWEQQQAQGEPQAPKGYTLINRSAQQRRYQILENSGRRPYIGEISQDTQQNDWHAYIASGGYFIRCQDWQAAMDKVIAARKYDKAILERRYQSAALPA